jgi:hypothetical protein
MTYKYKIIRDTPERIEELLNDAGKNGFRVLHIQALNKIKGIDFKGQPVVDFQYEAFLIKPQKENG